MTLRTAALTAALSLLACDKAPAPSDTDTPAAHTGLLGHTGETAAPDTDAPDDSGGGGHTGADTAEDTGGAWPEGWYVDCEAGDDGAGGRSPDE